MTRHDPSITLRHMLAHAREVTEMVAGRSRRDLDNDRMFSLAMVRLLEIIGEAAARVPEAIRCQHPHVPWRDITDLRNRLIHGYDAIDFDRVWIIANDDLPPLIRQLQSLVNSNESDSSE